MVEIPISRSQLRTTDIGGDSLSEGARLRVATAQDDLPPLDQFVADVSQEALALLRSEDTIELANSERN